MSGELVDRVVNRKEGDVEDAGGGDRTMQASRTLR